MAAAKAKSKLKTGRKPKAGKAKAEPTALDIVHRAAGILFSRKAEDMLLLDLRGLSSLTDYYLICTCQNEAQMRAALGAAQRALSREGVKALLVGVALLSLVWTPEDPARMRILQKLRGPLVSGLLGTDHLGRDLASMLMRGAFNSLTWKPPPRIQQIDRPPPMLTPTAAGLAQAVDRAMQDATEVVRKRIDELGTREPTIIRQGANRIVVQVPGLENPQALKDLLGKKW